MSEHQLLLRHAANWARERDRVCDTELLEDALELRLGHDGLQPTHWPAGSVEDLMLRRWPANGAGIPEVDVLADSLDTLVRFLRSTGRMASGSADPRALAREAHRAAPKMVDACRDAANFGPTKSLLAFGREAGFDVDGASGIEDLQGTLDQVVKAWNALPEEERRARMPLGDLPETDVDELFDPNGVLERGDPARAAEQARRAPLVQACLRLVDWVGERRQVTATGVLRLAEARKAYAELELWRWQEEVDVMAYGHADSISREFLWKRAGDALALERLWFASQSARLLETRATVARDAGDRPVTDGEWVALAVSLTLALWTIIESSSYGRFSVPVLAVIGACALEGSITQEEVREEWAMHPANPWQRGDLTSELREHARRYTDREVDLSLHFFADTGIWEVDDGTYRLTDLGREFATILFSYLDEETD